MTSLEQYKPEPAPLAAGGNGFGRIMAEVVALIGTLPNKGVFVVLLAGWCALFSFFGNNTFGYFGSPSLFVWLHHVYTHSPNDDYCSLIPVLVLVLLVGKRQQLTRLEKTVWLPGSLLIAAGAGLHVVGYLVQQNRISIVGLVVGLYGITGLCWGACWLARTFFPMFLLLFLVPLGAVQDALTLPLRIFVTQGSVLLGNLFLGLGYSTRGSMILTDLGQPVFDVAPACSGIRSLISLFALSTIYAFMRFDVPWKRLIVIAAALPLAVLGNLLRILIVLIVGRAVSFEAGAMIEQKLGFLTFLVAFAGLFLTGRWLREKSDAPSLTAPTGLSASA